MIRNLIAKMKVKKLLSFNSRGVEVSSLKETNKLILWERVTKILFVNSFEEYSGYFLTEEYKNGELYHGIYIDCNQNLVKIRTGGAPTIKNNTSNPFSRKFGTTSVYEVIFIEYLDKNGMKCLYAAHYKQKNKLATIRELKKNFKNNQLFVEKRIEGFNYIYNY